MRKPSTVRGSAPAVGRGISPAVPATAWSCSASAAWIPAFAGMTEEGVPGCAVRTVIPAFAGMTEEGVPGRTVRTIIPAFAGMTTPGSMPSFPRRRESIGGRQSRLAERRTHQSQAPLPSFPRRRESIGGRQSRLAERRTHQSQAPLPSFPRRRGIHRRSPIALGGAPDAPIASAPSVIPAKAEVHESPGGRGTSMQARVEALGRQGQHRARHRVLVARRAWCARRLRDPGPDHHGDDLGRPLRAQPGEGLLRAVHEGDGDSGEDRAVRRRSRRASPAGEQGRDHVGSAGHDHGRQPRRLQRQGLLEPIDHSMLLPALDGTPADEDFVEGALTDCGVSQIVYAMVLAYNRDAFPGERPARMKDLFDTPTLPREARAAEAPGGEPRMGAPILRGAARGPLPVVEHGAGASPRVRAARHASGTRSSGGRPSTQPVELLVSGEGRDRGAVQRAPVRCRGHSRPPHRDRLGRADLRARLLGNPQGDPAPRRRPGVHPVRDRHPAARGPGEVHLLRPGAPVIDAARVDARADWAWTCGRTCRPARPTSRPRS